jgi:predicted  nucleic acid-binding Zn-ribbon protein
MNDTDLEQIRAFLADALAPMQADLTAVKADLTAVKTDLTTVKTDVAANGTALTTLRTEVNAIKAKVDSWPDLHFLQAAAQRQQTDTASLRDDIRVLSAIAMRLDGSHSVLLDELRATHTQIGRMNDRVRKLEDAQAPPL